MLGHGELEKALVGNRHVLGIAFLCAVMLRGSTFEGFLPFLFLGVLIIVAMRFGVAAGIVGTIAAAMIFAVLLFKPVLSIRISDSVARSNLIWMVIL